jgi:hypothetical protein
MEIEGSLFVKEDDEEEEVEVLLAVAPSDNRGARLRRYTSKRASRFRHWKAGQIGRTQKSKRVSNASGSSCVAGRRAGSAEPTGGEEENTDHCEKDVFERDEFEGNGLVVVQFASSIQNRGCVAQGGRQATKTQEREHNDMSALFGGAEKDQCISIVVCDCGV